jgi:hypothetical protein
MAYAIAEPRFETMINLKSLHWPLILGLGVLALVRPVTNIIRDQAGMEPVPAIPVTLTVLISAAWILVVGLSRVPSPLLTLLFAGLTYGVLSTVLSAVLSPILLGQLQGPLTNPFALVSVLLINGIWGLAAGGLAWLVRRVRRNDRQPVG